MRRSTTAAALAAAMLLVACGAGSDANSTDPISAPDPIVTSAIVQATPANQFTPATINLAAGGTIEFEFGVIPHNVYFDDAPPGAPDNIAAPTFNTRVGREFRARGRYVYHCHLHPGMSGVIVVQ